MFNNLIEFIPHNCHEYMVVPSVVLIKRNIFAIALVYIHLMTSKASIASHTHTQLMSFKMLLTKWLINIYYIIMFYVY